MTTKIKVFSQYAVCCHNDKLFAEPFLGRNDTWTPTPSAGGNILDFEMDADDSRFLAIVQVEKKTVLKSINWVRGNFARSWNVVKELD